VAVRRPVQHLLVPGPNAGVGHPGLGFWAGFQAGCEIGFWASAVPQRRAQPNARMQQSTEPPQGLGGMQSGRTPAVIEPQQPTPAWEASGSRAVPCWHGRTWARAHGGCGAKAFTGMRTLARPFEAAVPAARNSRSTRPSRGRGFACEPSWATAALGSKTVFRQEGLEGGTGAGALNKMRVLINRGLTYGNSATMAMRYWHCAHPQKDTSERLLETMWRTVRRARQCKALCHLLHRAIIHAMIVHGLPVLETSGCWRDQRICLHIFRTC
jgi:hypothetical protein